MLTKTEAESRVAKGAAHLDTVRPGWFNRIDVGTLTMWDPCGCIVGQLCGLNHLSTFDAMGWPFIHASHSLFGDRDDCGAAYGVVLDGVAAEDNEAYGQLQDAWIAAIADRKLAQDVVSEPVVAHVER